jgi:hypothetical protein
MSLHLARVTSYHSFSIFLIPSFRALEYPSYPVETLRPNSDVEATALSSRAEIPSSIDKSLRAFQCPLIFHESYKDIF